jgi:hypothetical protein
MFFLNLDVSRSERFDMAKFMEFTDNYDPLTSRFFFDLPKAQCRSLIEVGGEEGRPDLLSFKKYGSTQYWWILALFPCKLDYNDFSIGENVKTPEMSSLEEVYFGLKALETIQSK